VIERIFHRSEEASSNFWPTGKRLRCAGPWKDPTQRFCLA